jgi:hypothetical protein
MARLTLHPALPLIRDIPTQETPVFARILDRRQAQQQETSHQRADNLGVVYLVFKVHQCGAVGKEEVDHGEAKCGEGRGESGRWQIGIDRG